MDRFKEFQESFMAHLQALYKAMQGKSNKDLDDALVRQGKSDEQKQIIQETCQDVDKEHDRAVSMGAQPVFAPTTEPWGQRTCYVADPEGNLIEISSFIK